MDNWGAQVQRRRQKIWGVVGRSDVVDTCIFRPLSKDTNGQWDSSTDSTAADLEEGRLRYGPEGDIPSCRDVDTQS